MITREELEGQWNQLKGSIQERWGDLTDDELSQAKGNTNQLVGVIQQRTGESRRAIEDFLEETMSSGSSMMHNAMDSARAYADHAAAAARRQYEQASEATRRSYDQMAAGFESGVEHAQEYVRARPVESVAVAFGAGLVAGVITGLVLRSR